MVLSRTLQIINRVGCDLIVTAYPPLVEQNVNKKCADFTTTPQRKSSRVNITNL